MLSFRLLLAPDKLVTSVDQIESMKADLARYLPDIKSSHRVEALARALGYKTYASLRARNENVIVDVSWPAFDNYLKEKGFHATAKPLFLAAGRACMRLTMDFADYRTLQRHVYEERKKLSLDDIFSDTAVEEFLRSCFLLIHVPHTQSPTKGRNSLDMKRLAEEIKLLYPDGEESPPSFVATSSFVLAALGSGFWFEPLDGELENLHFNMMQEGFVGLVDEINSSSF